jgi:hypothetical protein
MLPAAVAPPVAAAAVVVVAVVVADELQSKTANFFLITMKTSSKNFLLASWTHLCQALLNRRLTLALALAAPFAVNAADSGKTFATPEAAVAALVAATSTDDSEALHTLFGPATADFVNPDRVQATNEYRAFTAALNQTNWLDRESDSRCVLVIGENSWPFPIPIVKRDGQWLFDTEAGKNELLNRRIGKNELSTLQTMRACVEAQRDYATKDRDGDEVLEFAQKFASSRGVKDGLYWPPDLDGEISPLGPLVADAQDEGYRRKARKESAGPEPFHGYFFKMLTRQGKSAPGGKYDYIINGNMIGGFAVVAWPAEYGESGIMTFIVNQQGRVYQKDLGSKTGKIADTMKEYNPDKTWSVSAD